MSIETKLIEKQKLTKKLVQARIDKKLADETEKKLHALNSSWSDFVDLACREFLQGDVRVKRL